MKPSETDLNFWLYCWNPHSRWYGSDDISGKWMITFESMEELDNAYEKLRDACIAGDLGPCFKTSTALENSSQPDFKHFAVVYVEDYTKEKKTKRVLKALRKLGFDKELKFKRDLETFMGIYGEHSFYMVSKEGAKAKVFEPYAQ